MAKATQTATRWPILPDPLRPIFRLLTSVRFALGIIAFMALAGVAGIILPQVPPERRAFPEARAEWFAEQEDKFGFWYEPLNALGLFDLFNTWWFYTGLVILVVGIGVCTMGRWAPTWRNAFRPPRQVPDRYFETARHRQDFENPPGGLRIEEALRARSYRIEHHERAGTRYLFADKYAWAQMATFISHLAIVMLLIGGLTSRLFAVDEFVFIPEGGTRPVFDLEDDDHMQLAVSEAVGEFDGDGNALDFRTDLTIYQDGREVATGEATVNDPLEWNGYRLHQTAYSADGVALRVTEGDRPLYRETVVLGGTQVSPFLRINDGSREIFAEQVIISDLVPGSSSVGRLITVPGRETIIFAGLSDAGDEFNLELREANPPTGRAPFGATLKPGEDVEVDGLTYSFVGVSTVPADVVEDVPGADDGAVVTQLGRHADGEPYITLTGLGEAGASVTVEEGESTEFGGFEYGFEGVRDFSGITVRKDPGVTFLWVGVAMLLGGLLVTFYTPRRRLWVKLGDERTYLAGQAAHLVNLEKEMRQIGAEAGAVGVKLDDDEDDED
ncbi:MAG TPA: cytochrome c biogenesis protein ResB [Dehalococcoidia bacterium]|nr:cytochrome c biogenesis protein ResB [Dehalococcoidia bacterium]